MLDIINQSVPRFTTQHTSFEKKNRQFVTNYYSVKIHKATAFVKCFRGDLTFFHYFIHLLFPSRQEKPCNGVLILPFAHPIPQ